MRLGEEFLRADASAKLPEQEMDFPLKFINQISANSRGRFRTNSVTLVPATSVRFQEEPRRYVYTGRFCSDAKVMHRRHNLLLNGGDW